LRLDRGFWRKDLRKIYAALQVLWEPIDFGYCSFMILNLLLVGFVRLCKMELCKLINRNMVFCNFSVIRLLYFLSKCLDSFWRIFHRKFYKNKKYNNYKNQIYFFSIFKVKTLKSHFVKCYGKVTKMLRRWSFFIFIIYDSTYEPFMLYYL
jgi:hypothetical protein